MRISYADGLRGRSVVDAHGRVIGEITELFVETDSWRVEGVGVRLTRDAERALGAHRGPFRAVELELPIEEIQSVGDTIVLRRPVESLGAADRGASPGEHRPAP